MSTCLTFDWFRNLDGDRGILRRNVAWSYHYLAGTRVFGASLSDLLARADCGHEPIEASGLQNTHHAWALTFDDLSGWPKLAEYFLDGCEADVVVGFELSRGQRALLAAEGKTYIDLRTHPVRFLPDYMFAAATNDADLHTRLAALSPPRSYVDRYVNFARARAARRYTKRMNTECGMVFFAQTAVDSSRIRDGEIADDLFILEQLQGMVDRFEPKNLFVKHHPHEKMSPQMLRALKDLDAKETHTNTYDLLSADGLRCAALSSSVCHEAQYFDARPTTFLAPLERFPMAGEDSVPGDYLMMPANLYQTEIWAYLLDGGAAPAPVYPEFQTPYRSASGLSWG